MVAGTPLAVVFPRSKGRSSPIAHHEILRVDRQSNRAFVVDRANYQHKLLERNEILKGEINTETTLLSIC